MRHALTRRINQDYLGVLRKEEEDDNNWVFDDEATQTRAKKLWNYCEHEEHDTPAHDWEKCPYRPFTNERRGIQDCPIIYHIKKKEAKVVANRLGKKI
jgi:hypothetical protein